jgi:hypothetical protein
MTPLPPLRTRCRAIYRPSTALIAILLVVGAWLGGTGRTIAVFAALLVLADMRAPRSPGAGRLDADEQFNRLLRARRLGRSAPLPVLKTWAGGSRELGLQTIDLDAIAGTVKPAKAREFDRELRPTRACADRWKPLWLAYRLGEPVPPVSLYRVDGRYWLCDGHHRVSVLRHQGAAAVDAHVTEWR